MIGRVFFDAWGRSCVATLGDDGRWTVEVPGMDRAASTLASSLNVDLTTEGHSPADGQPGHRQMAEAAERLGGRVEAPRVKDGVPGTAY